MCKFIFLREFYLTLENYILRVVRNCMLQKIKVQTDLRLFPCGVYKGKNVQVEGINKVQYNIG